MIQHHHDQTSANLVTYTIKNKPEGTYILNKKANVVISSRRRARSSPHSIVTHFQVLRASSLIVEWYHTVKSSRHANGKNKKKQHHTSYLWQVGEVKAVVRAWETGSQPPNSFSCCYGNCERRETKQRRKKFAYATQFQNTITQHMCLLSVW